MAKIANLLALLACSYSAHAADVDAILSEMSTEQKIGQMNQIDIDIFMDGLTFNEDKFHYWMETYHVGSILNSPFSFGQIDGKAGWTAQEWRDAIVDIQEIAQNTSNLPILFGIDSIHGASYVHGATLFPQQLSTAATFNIELARRCGEITAKDTRAAGIPWLFSPVLGIGLNPLWARFWETFGEDPYLAASMATSIIEGIQADPEDGCVPPRAAACMKHFIAYSAPETGHDRAPVQMSDRSMKQLFLPSFQAAVDAGVLTSMESYNDFGGVPMVSSSEYLRDLIRFDMGFEGLLVTDYAEIENLNSWHRVAATQKEAVEIAFMNTTIDMSMVPLDGSFYNYTMELVSEGVVSMERIDDSVRRILDVKNVLGLLDTPVPPRTDPLLATVGQTSDWDDALDAARESITLLKNEGSSPLPRSPTDDIGAGKRILVTGPTCDSLRAQSGGWTYHWQGAADDSEFTNGVTVKQGLEQVFSDATIDYLPGPSMDAVNISSVDMTAMATAADNAELVVLCIGEDSYTEKPGDINDLSLPSGQVEFVKSLAESTSTPIVMVIISGRPRLLQGIANDVSAVLNAYLPGPMGGQAVAEIIAGDVNPSGRLPYTYPKDSGSIPYPYHHKPSSQCVDSNGDYINCEVEWAFGTGLSYTTFAYSDLSLSSSSVDENGAVVVSVTVSNTGDRAGKVPVLMFLVDVYRRVSPEYKLLKRFSKVELSVGEAKTVEWTLSAAEDLKYIGIDGRYVLESGEYRVGIDASTDCRENASMPLCASFELSLTDEYNSVCDAACVMWENGICGDSIDSETCSSQCRQEQWDWNYVDCLEETISGGCVDWQCYDAFPTSTASTNNSDCGDTNYDYTSNDLAFGTLISALAGVLVGSAATWLFLFARYSLRGSLPQAEERRSLTTTQSPIAGGSGSSVE